MKRFFAFLVSMIFVFSVAFADFDISEMSDEELYSLINNARLELIRRNNKNQCFVDDSYVKIVKTGSGNLISYTSAGRVDNCFLLGIAISNVSDTPYELYIDSVAINGWEAKVYDRSSGVIRSKMNKKYHFELMYSDAYLENYKEMTDIIVCFSLKNNGKTIENYTINFTFNGDEWN